MRDTLAQRVMLLYIFTFVSVELTLTRATIAMHINSTRWELTFTSHINCIVARCLINVVYLTACAFIRL